MKCFITKLPHIPIIKLLVIFVTLLLQSFIRISSSQELLLVSCQVYSFAKKQYKVYSLVSKSYFVSRDIYSHEHIFHFSQSSSIVASPPTLPFSFYIFDFSDNSPPSIVPAQTSCFTSSSSPSSSSIYSSSSISCSSPSFAIPTPSYPSIRKSSRPYNPPSYLKDYICAPPASFLNPVLLLLL